MSASIALVGGRGYTGAELLGLIARHPRLELALASSTSIAGRPLRSVCGQWPDESVFIDLAKDHVCRHPADAWVLAVPNGAAAGWVSAIRQAQPKAVILDLSADHRFDDRWTYGLTERFRGQLRGARDIANPGCYATGAQLALLPLLGRLAGAPSVFGVSGFSGAGRTPSARNDPERLADNLVPYSLAGHVHETEISAQLGTDVRFMPHVATFFRGISLTVSAQLDSPSTAAELSGIFKTYYAGERFIVIRSGPPEIRDIRGGPEAHIGGFAIDARDPRRVTLVAVLDNLAKGAATQAMQNLNLALGMDEHLGIIADD